MTHHKRPLMRGSYRIELRSVLDLSRNQTVRARRGTGPKRQSTASTADDTPARSRFSRTSGYASTSILTHGVSLHSWTSVAVPRCLPPAGEAGPARHAELYSGPSIICSASSRRPARRVADAVEPGHVGCLLHAGAARTRRWLDHHGQAEPR